MADAETGYVNYCEILGVGEDPKPGEVRKVYRRKMKALVGEIARVEITQERRAHYLLEMAKLNAALCVLRDTAAREQYWNERKGLIALEEQWRQADGAGSDEADGLRRKFDARVRDFLSKYVEELMLDAGNDKECVDASHWDTAHERHAFRILRHYRHGLYQEILERLPYAGVTRPSIDWDERSRLAASILAERG
ncbi:MAG: hypothetical protein JXR94_24860 [Candidatus Hydrogenedentes bacterium]|nr:hypothetical protein [Candidatus Hydrogenedentota bacterium]